MMTGIWRVRLYQHPSFGYSWMILYPQIVKSGCRLNTGFWYSAKPGNIGQTFGDQYFEKNVSVDLSANNSLKVRYRVVSSGDIWRTLDTVFRRTRRFVAKLRQVCRKLLLLVRVYTLLACTINIIELRNVNIDFGCRWVRRHVN